MRLALVGKLRALSPADWRDMLAAQAALLRAQLEVWTRPRGDLPIRAALLVPAETAAKEQMDDPVVTRISRALGRAARYGVFRPTCLVRALALQRMLRRRGFPDSSVRVGVRRRSGGDGGGGGGALLAHAWVEYRGAVLADEEWRVRQFEELARL